MHLKVIVCSEMDGFVKFRNDQKVRHLKVTRGEHGIEMILDKTTPVTWEYFEGNKFDPYISPDTESECLD